MVPLAEASRASCLVPLVIDNDQTLLSTRNTRIIQEILNPSNPEPRILIFMARVLNEMLLVVVGDYLELGSHIIAIFSSSAALGIRRPFVNHSYSQRGPIAVRSLMLQPHNNFACLLHITFLETWKIRDRRAGCYLHAAPNRRS